MKKTKIEWCDSTWNPVTGCLHKCEYCYARRIANRFKGCDEPSTYWQYHSATWRWLNQGSPLEKAIYEVDAKCPPVIIKFNLKTQKRDVKVAPYPWGFQPTLRRDRYDEYVGKSPRTIFVCSMADLFGNWIPDRWLDEIFEVCEKTPQHKYLFLTKNPKRYTKYGVLIADNMWYGTTITKQSDVNLISLLPDDCKTFLSIEPLQEDINVDSNGSLLKKVDWVIIGAETGNRKEKVVPDKKWITDIVSVCKDKERPIPVFMKDSLVPIVGEENMLREFPWS